MKWSEWRGVIFPGRGGEALAPIYGTSKWRNGGHRERLRDLPGAEPSGPVHFKVVGTKKATRIPWAALGV